MILRKIISLTLVAAMTACSVTPANHTSGNKVSGESLMGEKVSHFMMTEDGNTLIVLGNKHHFSFPIDNNIKDILTWESRNRISASFYDVESQDGENVKLKYRLMMFKDSTPAQITFLKAHHFNYNSNIGFYELNNSLSGHYYAANDVDLTRFNKFKREYRLMYKGERIPVAKHNTSVTEVGGSLLFLGAALIIIPLMAITSPFREHKGAW